jgi:hypothetical protein
VNAAAADGRTALKVAQTGKRAEVTKLLEQSGGSAANPLPEPVPIPWPDVDPTGARVDYGVPEKVLRSFMFAMNNYENEADALDKELGPGRIRNNRILASMQRVFSAFCTPAKRPYGRAGSYGVPPEYDPENEILIGSKLVSARRAELTTRQQKVGCEFLYVLSKRAGRWLLESRKWRLIGARWSNHLL